MVIGLANIIPGISGGTMAVSMGIYDRLIYCVNHLFKDLKKNILFLLPILAGMGIAVCASAFGIDYFFETFPVQTNLMFIGLILGSLPMIYGKVKASTIRLGHLLSGLIFFVIVVGMAMLNGQTGKTAVLTADALSLLKLFGVGIIASATMVIPGVSGSMMLLLMGYYNPILDMIQAFIRALLALDMGGMFRCAVILIPFGIGVCLGIIVIARVIEWVLVKYPLYAYWGIMGLVLSSPVAILMVAEIPSVGILSILTGLIACIGGFYVASRLGE